MQNKYPFIQFIGDESIDLSGKTMLQLKGAESDYTRQELYNLNLLGKRIIERDDFIFGKNNRDGSHYIGIIEKHTNGKWAFSKQTWRMVVPCNNLEAVISTAEENFKLHNFFPNIRFISEDDYYHGVRLPSKTKQYGPFLEIIGEPSDFSKEEFKQIFNKKNKSILDYRSKKKIIDLGKKILMYFGTEKRMYR